MYIYIYVCMYIYLYIYIHVHIKQFLATLLLAINMCIGFTTDASPQKCAVSLTNRLREVADVFHPLTTN